MTPEVKLFQAVVLQAVEDACRQLERFEGEKYRAARPGMPRKKKSPAFTPEYNEWLTNAREIEDARSWLLGGAADFREICACAGFDHTYIRRKAQALAATGWRRPTTARREAA